MRPGLYDQVIDLFLEREMLEAKDHCDFGVEKLDPADSHDYLAQYLHSVLLRSLAQVKPADSKSSDKEKSQSKISRQITICNEIVNILKSGISGIDAEDISFEASKAAITSLHL